MSLYDFYLKKYAHPKQLETVDVREDLNFIIVIPAIDEKHIIETLQSLQNAESPKSSIEIIVVINSSDHSPSDLVDRNRAYYEQVVKYAELNNSERWIIRPILIENLKKKHAGAGWARKIGMDEAVRRFNTIDKNGIIINLDADTLVEKNYLREIEKYFSKYPKRFAANIYYEHPISGNSFDSKIYQLIYEYELHLRYNVQMLKFAGFPFAFHTLGSAFCVSADAYTKVNGMNRRTAGEDFYFLHKLTQLGSLGAINSTCVYPSPRPSYRVPFGTGALIKQSLENNRSHVETYAPEIYLHLKDFWSKLPEIYQKSDGYNLAIHSILSDFLKQNNFENSIREIKANTSDYESFRKRFFQWFNGFKVVKYQNYATKFFPKKGVLEFSSFLAKNEKDLLSFYRKKDKNNGINL